VYSASDPLLLAIDRQSRDPLQDIAIGPAWLRQVAAGEAAPALRIYRPRPTVAFSGRDCLEPGIPQAIRVAREHDFVPVRRGPGGRATAYHRGAVGLDHIGSGPHQFDGIRQRFHAFGQLLAEALRSLGVDAQVGPVPGEYCPGEFSVNDGRGHKLVGTAQRLVRGGWLFSSMIIVTGAQSVADVLDPIYRALGLQWDPATVGAVEDAIPGITVDRIEAAVVQAYGARHELVPTEVPTAVERLADDSRAKHLVPADGTDDTNPAGPGLE